MLLLQGYKCISVCLSLLVAAESTGGPLSPPARGLLTRKMIVIAMMADDHVDNEERVTMSEILKRIH